MSAKFATVIASPMGMLRHAFGDAACLAEEIRDFVFRSVKACEAGYRPWERAIAVGIIFGLAVGIVGELAAQRAVAAPLSGSYWLTRVLSARWLAGIYAIAFLVAFRQNKELIGDRGILPSRLLLDRADAAAESRLRRDGYLDDPGSVTAVRRMFARVEMLPTLLWLVRNRRSLDRWLDSLAVSGLVLALLIVVRGGASAWHWLALWVIYHSINAVGQRWYSFGWEAQLLETGMLALLVAPGGLFSCSSPGAAFPAGAAPPGFAPWAFRWMAFRIMLGAGLIKLRGAKCWLDLTAMCHHLETQPIPNPFTRFWHTLPRPMLLFMTASNHVIELFAPFLVLLPWRPAQVAFGATHVIFQMSLILTGNLSFLNWLTVVPGLWCFDDAVLIGLLPGSIAESVAREVESARRAEVVFSLVSLEVLASWLRSGTVLLVIVWLSVPVYQNLLGPSAGGGRQKMNSSFERRIVVPKRMVGGLQYLFACFHRRVDQAHSGAESKSAACGATSEGNDQDMLDPAQKRRRVNFHTVDTPLMFDLRCLRLLNTFGTFGSVNLERIEIVFEGLDASSGTWRPYTFKAAVDDPMKRPAFLAPYHFRLDWCRWIASCRGRRASGLQEQWVLAFVGKLLLGDPGTRRLLRRPGGDPFEGGPPPSKVRAGLFSFRFAPPPKRPDQKYWIRERVGEYLPPQTLRELAPRLLEWGIISPASHEN